MKKTEKRRTAPAVGRRLARGRHTQHAVGFYSIKDPNEFTRFVSKRDRELLDRLEEYDRQQR